MRRRWNGLAPAGKRRGIATAAIHTSYLINLASEDPKIRERIDAAY